MTEARRAVARLAAELATREAAVAETQLQLAAAEAAVAEEDALVSAVLAPLPADLVRLVFLLLPADVRLRSREVCRGWRAFLSDNFLWRVCDLSTRSGVMVERTPALLRAACERALGTLEVLDVTGWRGLFDEVEEEDEESSRLLALLPVLHANAGSLVELRAWDCFEPAGEYYLGVEDIEALLSAAPRLRVLECDAGAEAEEPATTLRLLEEPQFAPVRLQAMRLEEQGGFPLDVPAASAKIALHTSLLRLELVNVDLDTEPALVAVVNLAVSQLQHLIISFCDLSPASLPALTRMLGSGSLKELFIYNVSVTLLVGASVPAFCAALRASRLVELTLAGMELWGSLEDGLAVIAACTRHPTLRKLDFQCNGLEGAAGHEAIEAALDALLEASNAELDLVR